MPPLNAAEDEAEIRAMVAAARAAAWLLTGGPVCAGVVVQIDPSASRATNRATARQLSASPSVEKPTGALRRWGSSCQRLG